MLKTECPCCKNWVCLPPGAASGEFACEVCSGPVPVKGVHVASGRFMMCRDLLADNLVKYRRLLGEAEKEAADLRKKDAGGGDLSVSIRSLELFIGSLRELLGGCRTDQRHTLAEPAAVEYLLDGSVRRGSLVNISIGGACLETDERTGVERLFGPLALRLECAPGALSVPGRIMWIGRENLIGVKFSSVEEKETELLRAFIAEKIALQGR